MAFFQTLCKGSYQECPGFCVKEDGHYPSATQLKLRNFLNKTWSQKKQTLCLLSTKVYRPTKLTWVVLEFCISQNPSGLHSGALILAFAVPQPKLEMKMPLWSPVHFLNLFFSHCFNQGWFEVQTPDFNFPEIQDVQLQDFYLRLSLAWLQGKGE